MQKLRFVGSPRVATLVTIVLGLLLAGGVSRAAKAQNGVNPLNISQNYFVTGDYVVAGWSKGAPDGSGYARVSVIDARGMTDSVSVRVE